MKDSFNNRYFELLTNEKYTEYAYILSMGLSRDWYSCDVKCCDWEELRNAYEKRSLREIIECSIALLQNFSPSSPTCYLCGDSIEDNGAEEVEVYHYEDDCGIHSICHSCMDGLIGDEKGIFHDSGNCCAICGKFFKDNFSVYCKDCQSSPNVIC
jgi:hypothetical protein